ncbi:MAG: AAA family ATPase [Patescibacteria group bacterium]
MIRLEGSRGVAVARAELQHNSVLWRTARLAGVVVVGLALLYWAGGALSLVDVSPFFLGLAELVVGVAILVGIAELYYHVAVEPSAPVVPLSDALKRDDWQDRVNIADYASRELATVLLASRSGATFDISKFLQALLMQRTTRVLLDRAGLAGDVKGGAAGQAPGVAEPVNSVEAVLTVATTLAAQGFKRHVHVSHVLRALARHHQGFANLLFANDVKPEDLDAAIAWYERVTTLARGSFFWERGKIGVWGIGRDWAAGYTPTLSQYAVDLSSYLREAQLQAQITGRQAEIDQLVTSLASERRSNALLVGQPGVGKTTIVNGLAARIASGEVPRSLADKHVFQLDVGRVLAGLMNRGELEVRLLKILGDAAHAGNIILFIKDIHVLLAAEEGKTGAVNAAETLLPFLESGRIQLIGTTTPSDYHGTIEVQSAVAQLFSRVDVAPATPEDTLVQLQDVALHLEVRQRVFIAIPTIRVAVERAERYLANVPLPESAIRVLEAAAVAAGNRGGGVLTVKDVDDVVAQLAKVPVGDVETTEKDKLLNLEAVLHERVVGQDEAVQAVAAALRRARSGLASQSRPIGSFLFLGPTGVGKTETARALAAVYFGAEDAMVRIDMSEFQSPASLARLIGAPTEANKAGAGQLTSALRDKPFSLVLLDEIEKAHPNVLNVFLQILDDGRVSDGRGEPVDFRNAIIIATSNAGSAMIREAAKTGELGEGFKEQLINHLQSEGQFKSEFLNRFDAVVAFKPLSLTELSTIVDYQLKALNARLSSQEVQVALTDAARTRLAELGYKPEFGARALRRVLQEKVENLVADRLLKGEVQRGQIVTIDLPDLGGVEAERQDEVKQSTTSGTHTPTSGLQQVETHKSVSANGLADESIIHDSWRS